MGLNLSDISSLTQFFFHRVLPVFALKDSSSQVIILWFLCLFVFVSRMSAT